MMATSIVFVLRFALLLFIGWSVLSILAFCFVGAAVRSRIKRWRGSHEATQFANTRRTGVPMR